MTLGPRRRRRGVDDRATPAGSDRPRPRAATLWHGASASSRGCNARHAAVRLPGREASADAAAARRATERARPHAAVVVASRRRLVDEPAVPPPPSYTRASERRRRRWYTRAASYTRAGASPRRALAASRERECGRVGRPPSRLTSRGRARGGVPTVRRRSAGRAPAGACDSGRAAPTARSRSERAAQGQPHMGVRVTSPMGVQGSVRRRVGATAHRRDEHARRTRCPAQAISANQQVARRTAASGGGGQRMRWVPRTDLRLAARLAGEPRDA